MTTYTLFRLSDRQAQKELATQRRYMQRHRAELADTRNPDTLRRYMEFNRLSIICAKRGYMLCIFLYPISRAALAAAAYRIEQALRVPSVHRRFTSSVVPLSSLRLTGLPQIATPTSLPSCATPMLNLCPATCLWCRWYCCTNPFASRNVTGTSSSMVSLRTFRALGSFKLDHPHIRVCFPAHRLNAGRR